MFPELNLTWMKGFSALISLQLKISIGLKQYSVHQKSAVKTVLAIITLKYPILTANRMNLEKRTANFLFQATNVIFARPNQLKMLDIIVVVVKTSMFAKNVLIHA